MCVWPLQVCSLRKATHLKRKDGRLNEAPKDTHIQILGNRMLPCYLQRDFWCDYINDLEMGILSWIIGVAPQWNHKCFFRKMAGWDLTIEEKIMWGWNRHWSDVTTSLGNPAATRSWKRLRKDSYLKPPQKETALLTPWF